jgi:hypothetical protein
VSGDEHEPRDEVGSVAEEAAKLFGALGDLWGDRPGGGASGLAGHAARTLRDLDDHLGEHLATGAPECTYCPVCRTVHAVRQTSPEVRAHLRTAAGALVQAAAGWLATTVPDQGSADRSTGVEHIDLDGGPENGPGDTGTEPGTEPEEDGR